MIAAPAIQEGRFEDAESLVMTAFETGEKLGVDNNEGVMGIQMFTIRREQGRLVEIAPIVKHFVDEHGAGAAWRPGLALIYAEIGELEKARVEFVQLAADGFGAVPRDSLWQTCLTYLAEVCCALDAAEDAQVLYDLLLPYEKLTVVVGVKWLISFLSADKKKTYCLYEASNAEAIREAAERNGIPADVIVEVGELSAMGVMGGIQTERFVD